MATKTTAPPPATREAGAVQSLFSPFVARYMENAEAMIATRTGTQRLAAAILSSLSRMANLMKARKSAATTPPSTGEITQLAAILPMVPQFTAAVPVAAIPAPSTPPTMAWVVETGAPQ